MEMVKGKSKNPFQEWVKAGMDHLQDQITRLSEALQKNIQRDTWIKWNGTLINLRAVETIDSGETWVRLFGSEELILEINLELNKHIQDLASQVGDKAVKDAAEVVFGWIQKSLIECGAGIVDIEQNLNALELKAAKPVELTKEMELDPVDDTEEFVAEVEAARDAVAE